VLADRVILNSIANYHRYPAGGVDGGGTGLPIEIRIATADGVEQLATERSSGARSPAKFSGLVVERGERIIVRMPGGGGWGDPRERAREAVEQDLRDELISREAAVENYGISPRRADDILASDGWERRRDAVRSAR
jgi:N-methylhydantoinase B